MNAPTRVAGFVLGLAAVFGTALAVGDQFGPVGEPVAADSMRGHSEDSGHAGETGHGGDRSTGSTEVPGGLMVSSGGYTLALQDPVAQAGRGRQVAFVINGSEGPVTSYDVLHEKRLHFIAVRRDFTGFQHVHPDLAPDGTWTTVLDLTPGPWRVFADFKPSGGDDLTLGSDLAVPGQVAVAPDRPATRVSTVDGYTVTLTGDLTSGEHSMLKLSVAKDGRPVTDLQPYLGAYGHLVALRGGDLAYLHVHPDGEPIETPRSSAPQEPPGDGETKPGPDVEFVAEVPSVGSYHLYLDFKHDGVVRTAEFALDAGQGHDLDD